MGLFDFINKAQSAVDNLQKKTEEWQEKANQFASGSTDVFRTESPLEHSSKNISATYICPICGNYETKGKKNTAHGELCAKCISVLKEKGISHRQAKHYTKEQIFGLCDVNLSPIDKAKLFIVPNSPVTLKTDEHCYYAGSACGGKIKTVTTGYTGGSKGYSVRVMKGVTYRSGGSAGHAVREQVLETSLSGTFAITNNRFILMTTQYGFEIPAHKIGNIEMRPDGLTLYAGNKTHIVVTNDVERIATIVRILSDATEEYEKQKALEPSKPKSSRAKKDTEKSAVSSADEIRKYKQLADEGIITVEEFEAKKKQLLGL